MKMHTYSVNKAVELDDYVNEHGIKKEDIVSTYQQKDGTFTIVYYAEE